MSFLNKLALGSLAAFALFRSKKPARSPAVVADEPVRGATAVKQARRKPAKRRAPARRVKSA